jgi:predicted FMN-binding regulatory protein PaiB
MLKIAALIDPDDTPVAYRFGETELGSFSFYTGRRVILIENEEDLYDYMSRHPDKILLARKKRWPFQMKPEDLDRQLIGSVQVGRDRHIFVLRFDGAIKLSSIFEGKDE